MKGIPLGGRKKNLHKSKVVHTWKVPLCAVGIKEAFKFEEAHIQNYGGAYFQRTP